MTDRGEQDANVAVIEAGDGLSQADRWPGLAESTTRNDTPMK